MMGASPSTETLSVVRPTWSTTGALEVRPTLTVTASFCEPNPSLVIVSSYSPGLMFGNRKAPLSFEVAVTSF